MNYLLGVFLLCGAVRLTAGLSGKHKRSHDGLANYLMKHLPTDDNISEGKFFIKRQGKLKITPRIITSWYDSHT